MGYTTVKHIGFVTHNIPLEPTRELTDRFWNKVDAHTGDDCWEWTGATSSRGYGSLHKHQIGSELAHRYIMKLCGYSIDDEQVNHHCDNKTCVNPAHLYAGTQSDNIEDAVDRERFQYGEEHHNSKLTEGDVVEIRDRYEHDHATQDELADEFDVNQSTIWEIVNHKIWRQAGGT
jgi:hypothetical protein